MQMQPSASIAMAKRAHLVLSLVIILGLSSVFSVDSLTDVHRYSQVLITENANYAAAAKALRFWIAYSPITAVVLSTLTGMEVPTVPSTVVLVLAAKGTYINQICYSPNLGGRGHFCHTLNVATQFGLYLHTYVCFACSLYGLSALRRLPRY